MSALFCPLRVCYVLSAIFSGLLSSFGSRRPSARLSSRLWWLQLDLKRSTPLSGVVSACLCRCVGYLLGRLHGPGVCLRSARLLCRPSCRLRVFCRPFCWLRSFHASWRLSSRTSSTNTGHRRSLSDTGPSLILSFADLCGSQAYGHLRNITGPSVTDPFGLP